MQAHRRLAVLADTLREDSDEWSGDGLREKPSTAAGVYPEDHLWWGIQGSLELDEALCVSTSPKAPTWQHSPMLTSTKPLTR